MTITAKSAHTGGAPSAGRDGFSEAARRGPGHDGVQGPYIYMHRAIMGAAKGDAVDHKNGDPLDNRKENLRIATQQENMRNKVRKPPNCTSKYKGVYWHRSMKKWAAEIRDCELLPSGKTRKRVIGYFSAEEDAARAYDAARLQLRWVCGHQLPVCERVSSGRQVPSGQRAN